jgi:GT2 family glycosyltransferase
MSRIDLILTGPGDVAWSLGDVVTAAATPAGLRDALERVVGSTKGDAVFCWDPALGAPDPELAQRLLAGRGDVWHAGLLLGTRAQPGLLDFVAPCWMFNADPDPQHEVTSWRASARACLARTRVWQQLGLPCTELTTLAGAMLEWGHRASTRGALMRHVPQLIAGMQPALADRLPLADELRFVTYRYGRSWARWAAARAALTGYAAPSEILPLLSRIGPRPYAEPAPYSPWAGGGAPDLANAKVTVLIPTIDRYPYLHTVLENLREQTVRPHEIIIIDQTATERRDHTLSTKFADLPLRLMYQDEPGQCVSRNAGLAVSSGDYVLFIDDDDEIGPSLIEDHLRNLARYQADVSSGVAQEVGTEPLPPEQRFVRASDVFPTNNTLVRREVLLRSGLFDLAFNRAPRADGELGIRVYLSGAFMVLDQSISVLHHHAPAGGLRTHKARVITYRSSRETLTQRHIPHISEIYLASRHFTDRQRREMLWMRTFGTLSGRGSAPRRLAKALVGAVMLPDTIKQTLDRRRTASEWLTRYPQIDQLR